MCNILTNWLKYKLWCSWIRCSCVSFTFLNLAGVNEVDKIIETPSSVKPHDSTAAQTTILQLNQLLSQTASTQTFTMEDLSQFTIRLFQLTIIWMYNHPWKILSHGGFLLATSRWRSCLRVVFLRYLLQLPVGARRVLSGVSLWRRNELQTKMSKYLLLRRRSQINSLKEHRKKKDIWLILSRRITVRGFVRDDSVRTCLLSYRAWLLRDMFLSCPAQRRSSLSNSCGQNGVRGNITERGTKRKTTTSFSNFITL